MKKYGRTAVPVYVLFNGEEWKVLPNTLRKSVLVDAINQVP